MSKRLKMTSLLGTAIIGLTAFTAVADPMGWFSKANIEYTGTDMQSRVSFDIGIWKDGSAEIAIAPIGDQPAENRAAWGEVWINDKLYKFAERESKEGEKVLYASIPVDGIPVADSFIFQMNIYNADDEPLLDEHFEYDFDGD